MADTNTKRPKLTKFYSPKGVAYFPYLNVPDQFKDKDTGKLGAKQFKTGLTVAAEFATPLAEQINAAIDAFHAETVTALTDEAKNGETGDIKSKAKIALKKLTKALPYRDVVNDEGDPTGDIRFNFGMNAEYKDKKTGETVARKLPLLDATGKNATTVAVWGGSVIKVCFCIAPYYMPSANSCGVKLRMEAVQVIQPKTSADREFGFGEEEGGFRDDGADGAPAGFPDGDAPVQAGGGAAGGDDEF